MPSIPPSQTGALEKENSALEPSETPTLKSDTTAPEDVPQGTGNEDSHNNALAMTPPEKERVPPTPSLERLTTYLHCLIDFGAMGVDTISSAQIEQQTGISAAQFRKDLSHFGEFGKPGVGYNVRELEASIAQILQIHKLQPIILIGAGNLGSALIGYPGLEEHKFHIVAAFDNDPRKIGKRLWGMDIVDVAKMTEINGALQAKMAVLAVPAHAAQAAAEAAAQAGVRAILNFAPVILRVPSHVIVRNVSFLQELAVLSYHLNESSAKVSHRPENGKSENGKHG